MSAGTWHYQCVGQLADGDRIATTVNYGVANAQHYLLHPASNGKPGQLQLLRETYSDLPSGA